MTTAASGLDEPTAENQSWNAKTIRMITGTDRKNSTTTEAGQRIQLWSDIRATPRIAPSGSAITTEISAALMVFHRPGSRYVVQFCASISGFHFSAVSWPLSASTSITHHTAATNRAAKTML